MVRGTGEIGTSHQHNIHAIRIPILLTANAIIFIVHFHIIICNIRCIYHGASNATIYKKPDENYAGFCL